MKTVQLIACKPQFSRCRSWPQATCMLFWRTRFFCLNVLWESLTEGCLIVNLQVNPKLSSPTCAILQTQSWQHVSRSQYSICCVTLPHLVLWVEYCHIVIIANSQSFSFYSQWKYIMYQRPHWFQNVKEKVCLKSLSLVFSDKFAFSFMSCQSHGGGYCCNSELQLCSCCVVNKPQPVFFWWVFG